MSKPNKGGAPAGNVNSLRHGLHSKALPKELEHLDTPLASYTRRLSREAAQVTGSLDMETNHHIDRCWAWTRHASICDYLLCTRTDLTVDQIISLSQGIAMALDKRHAPLAKLRLGKPITDPALQIPAPITFDSPQVPDDQPQDDAGDNRPESTDHHPDGKECGVGREGVELPASERDADQQ